MEKIRYSLIYVLVIGISLMLGTPQVGNPYLVTRNGQVIIEYKQYDPSGVPAWWYDAEVVLEGGVVIYMFDGRIVPPDSARWVGQYCVSKAGGYRILSASLRWAEDEIPVFFIPDLVYYPLCNRIHLPLIH